MPRYMVQREKREMPADFEETYLGGMVKMKDLKEKYRAGDATIERWIDVVVIRRAERIRGRK
jgi:hypothetical protein